MDANQPEIVRALEAAGCAVWPLERPVDLLCWFRGVYWLIEVKVPGKRDALTKAQKKFRASWPGPWFVVMSAEEALQVIGLRPVLPAGRVEYAS
jgi:hypothetical protein